MESRNAYRAGFTLIEAITIIGIVVLLLLVLMGMGAAGETRRILSCKHQLRGLGQAFAAFSREHQDALPPAAFEVGEKRFSWDSELAPYLEPRLNNTTAPEARKPLLDKIASNFKCPSDTEPRGGFKARSYSMPMYDLNKVSWPPDEICAGGVGLYLDAPRIEKARKAMPSVPGNYLPTITISTVKDPKGTASLVERISIQNAVWETKFACIVGPREQFDAKTIERQKFHRGKMNFLMVDGHVERLNSVQSEGFATSGGVWSLSPED